jgi:hypothetical protein
MATTFRSGSWSSSRSSGTRSSGGSRSSARTSKSPTKKTAPGYSSVCNSFNQRIQSYKTLCAQTCGAAKVSRPTPAALNTMAKWVEKGAVIQKVSSAQIKRWTNANSTFKSAATAKSALSRKFGKSTIKAVTRDKSGAFLVACACSTRGKCFSFPR